MGPHLGMVSKEPGETWMSGDHRASAKCLRNSFHGRHISTPVIVLFSRSPIAAELNLNGYIGMHFPQFGVKNSSSGPRLNISEPNLGRITFISLLCASGHKASEIPEVFVL